MPLGEWEDKPAWGRTRCVHDSPLYSRHELEVEAGGTCSVHWHRARNNRFHVVSGKIVVVQFFAWKTYETIVTPRTPHFDVPALGVHQFQVYEPGLVIEEYTPAWYGGAVLPWDIVRLCEGRRVPVGELKYEAARLARDNLCHGLTADDYERFCDGCDAEQIKLFGRCRSDDLLPPAI